MHYKNLQAQHNTVVGGLRYYMEHEVNRIVTWAEHRLLGYVTVSFRTWLNWLHWCCCWRNNKQTAKMRCTRLCNQRVDYDVSNSSLVLSLLHLSTNLHCSTIFSGSCLSYVVYDIQHSSIKNSIQPPIGIAKGYWT